MKLSGTVVQQSGSSGSKPSPRQTNTSSSLISSTPRKSGRKLGFHSRSLANSFLTVPLTNSSLTYFVFLVLCSTDGRPYGDVGLVSLQVYDMKMVRSNRGYTIQSEASDTSPMS